MISRLNQIRIRHTLTVYNPLSWIYEGIKVNSKIVHIQHWAWYTGIVYCILLPILKIRQKRIVITVHNITPHVKNKINIFIDKIFNKIIFPFAHLFIIHNVRNKKKLIKLYNISEEKICIITHGVLKLDMYNSFSKNEARDHLGIPRKKKVILFFGYIWKYKGLDVMLKSLVLVKKELNDVVLLIVGLPFNDWKDYEKMIDGLDISKHVVTKLGYVPDSDVKIFFSASDICVFPYKEPFDTHGGAPALAISFKKPIIVTDIGGLPEYVLDKNAISDPEDVESLAKNIVNVLTNQKLLKKLSKDSEDLSKKLSWKNISEKTVGVYNKLIMNEVAEKK
jgi:glycosyltransferase involved in cell wall biosynthesis